MITVHNGKLAIVLVALPIWAGGSESDFDELARHDQVALKRVSRLVSIIAPFETSGSWKARETAIVRGSIEQMVPYISGTKISRLFLKIRVNRVIRNSVDPSLESNGLVCVELPNGIQPSMIESRNAGILLILLKSDNPVREKESEIEKEDEAKDWKEERLRRWIELHGLQNLSKTMPCMKLVDEGLLSTKTYSWDAFFDLIESEASLTGTLNEERTYLSNQITKMDPKGTSLSVYEPYKSIPVILAVADKYLDSGNLLKGLELYANTIVRCQASMAENFVRLPDPDLVHKELVWRNRSVEALLVQADLTVNRLRKRVSFPADLDVSSPYTELLKWLRSKERSEDLGFNPDKQGYEIRK